MGRRSVKHQAAKPHASMANSRHTRKLDTMFAPQSIAVIGASNRPGTVGQSVMRNLLFTGYTGTIYPVNPKRKSVMGVRCYESVKQIDDAVDLAVLIIPAQAVSGVLRECGEKGVKNAIVISAGFKEVGGEGVRLEAEVRQTVQEMGISLVGPNCLGLINTDPAVAMNASFARSTPAQGNIAFISQSGALCTAVLDYARGQGIGFSKFISFGNKSDLTENDFLCYLADDPQTDVILMYIEDLSNGRLFIDIARDITGERTPPKPILAIKTGRTPEGAGAAASHTGSLAGSDEVYDAILYQSGVMRVETVEDLFNYAMAFADQPLPMGNRVAIVTNAGGPGIMATDACVRYGLKLATFGEETGRWLKERLPPTANTHNPVDVIGDAQHDRYEAALNLVMADEGVDGAVVILTPQNMTDIEEIARVICEASDRYPKTLIASFMGLYDVTAGVNILRERCVPHYHFPESAVRSLSAMYNYTRWIFRPRTGQKMFEVDRERVQQVMAKAAEEGRTHLPEVEAIDVLKAYGLPVLKSVLARNRDEVAAACREVGYPLVLKIASPDILHKTDIGGVRLGIHDEAQAIQAFEEIVASARQHHPKADVWGVNVQETAPRTGAKEFILGSKCDPRFGALLMFGLGGIYTEALKDVSFRLAPIRELSAERMIHSIRAYKILQGIRGEKPSDVRAIEECLERLSQLVMDFPHIDELDINPLMVYAEGEGAKVVDARIILKHDKG